MNVCKYLPICATLLLLGGPQPGIAADEDMLRIPIHADDPLNAKEQEMVQAYTRDNKVENLPLFLRGVAKLPTTDGLFYRGSNETFHEGDVVTIDRFWSVSTDRRIGESFTDPSGSLLEIDATSARSIERYSVVDFEKEHILLPNTKFHVDSITKAHLKFKGQSSPSPITVPLVHLSEIAE